MAIVLTADHCEQIRKAIDIDLDEVVLPNSTILLDIYALYAAQKITARLPDSLDSSFEPNATLAAIFTCAALLIPAVKQIQQTRKQGEEMTFKLLDWDKKQLDLDNRADQIIEGILEKSTNVPILSTVTPINFALAKARRGCR